MAKTQALLVAALATSMGCSLILSEQPDADDTADASPIDGQPETDAPDRADHDFEAGLGEWTLDPTNNGVCDVEIDPTDAANQVVCCTAMAGGSNLAVVWLGIPATRHVDVAFRLYVETLPSNPDTTRFSPFAGVNDAMSASDAVISNMNVYPSGQFGTASVPGTQAGTVVDFAGVIPEKTWVDVDWKVSLETACAVSRATVVTGETSATSTLELTENVPDPIAHVLLGAFRQSGQIGTNKRCFDDVTIRQQSGC